MYYLLFHLLNVPTTYHTFRKSSSLTQRPVTSQVDIITQKIEGRTGGPGFEVMFGTYAFTLQMPSTRISLWSNML